MRQHGVVQLGQEFSDFADSAAVVAMLDLLVTVDTSVAHLAGAMGKAVALLLPFSPDFRWLLHRADSPWYPTARLFRQTRPGDWSAAAESIAPNNAAAPVASAMYMTTSPVRATRPSPRPMATLYGFMSTPRRLS